MKKLFAAIFTLIICGTGMVSAMSFEQAMSQKKPMAVLIYANWADNVQAIVSAYDAMGQQYADKYNFTKINICTEEAKGFNQKYHIYPQLPYVLLFRDNGKISRYLKADCISNDACFKERLDFFVD